MIPVKTGIIPIIPHHEDIAKPTPMMSKPASILTILSVSPTLHVMTNYLVFYDDERLMTKSITECTGNYYEE